MRWGRLATAVIAASAALFGFGPAGAGSAASTPKAAGVAFAHTFAYGSGGEGFLYQEPTHLTGPVQLWGTGPYIADLTIGGFGCQVGLSCPAQWVPLSGSAAREGLPQSVSGTCLVPLGAASVKCSLRLAGSGSWNVKFSITVEPLTAADVEEVAQCLVQENGICPLQLVNPVEVPIYNGVYVQTA